MIDLHSHILPGFDDGAKSVEESFEMLRESKRQGVNRIISTSHCYPKKESSIREYLADRNECLEGLRRAIAQSGEELPQIYAGCELNICRDFTEDDGLRELCIEGTDYMLLEMPYEPWTESVIEVVYKTTLKGIRPVMAHIDRFLYQKREMLNALFELDVLYQLNAEAFLDKRMIKQVDELFTSGCAHFVGTDMHNMSSRKPTMATAMEQVNKYLGEDYWKYLQNNNSLLLQNEELNPFAHKKLMKKTFFQRIFSK